MKGSECSCILQKSEDKQLEELLDDDPIETQRQLAESLQVPNQRTFRSNGKQNWQTENPKKT